MNIYYIAFILSIFFIVIKTIENKFIIKSPEFKIKNIVKDSFIIFILLILIDIIYNKFFKNFDTKSASPTVFLNQPDF